MSKPIFINLSKQNGIPIIIKKPSLYQLLKKTYPNTLQTTIQHYNLTKNNQSTYVITGDITAMWLRDSTNQFIPYLRSSVNCTYIASFAKGILNTQAQFIMVDPYTNAFKKFQTSKLLRPSYLNDNSQILIMGIPVDLCRKKQFATPHIWQRKFQIDSPAAYLRMIYEYYNKFKTLDFINLKILKALKRILTMVKYQSQDTNQQKINSYNKKYYTFYRSKQQLPLGSIAYSVYTGMIKTGFRPSDSPNQLPYNIPGNAMFASYLQLVANEVLSKIPSNSIFYNLANQISKQMIVVSKTIKQGINKFGVVNIKGKKIYAYQVDGMGNYRIYDDSNLPSLLSMPYLGFLNLNDSIYQNTRKFLLSAQNKFFYARNIYAGIGSSHTDQRYIWPLALITQIITSQSKNQILNCLDSLYISAKGNLMHESFSVDDPSKITRQWFAWANSFFGQMILHLADTDPSLLK